MSTEVAEQQRKLWVTSEQYIHGEISSEKLDQVEDTLTQARQKATIGLAEYRMRWFLLYSVSIWIFASLVVTLIVFLFTKNYLSLVFILPTTILAVSNLRQIIKYLFPIDERRYLLEKMKIQRELEKR